MEGNMKISIITVSYNAVKTIEQTIQSVVNQTYDNIEYIIIDGGSIDGTVDIIKKYEDNIAYWVSEPDKGIYDAMNKGINVATGDVIGIINSDDWYATSHIIAEVVQMCDIHDCDLVCGDMYYFDERGNPLNVNKCISKPMLSELKKRMNIAHPTVFIKKNIYTKYGCFNTKYKVAADYDLMLRLSFAGVVAKYSPSVVVNFRLGGASSSDSFYIINEVAKIRKNNHINVLLRYRYYMEDVFFTLLNMARKYAKF